MNGDSHAAATGFGVSPRRVRQSAAALASNVVRHPQMQLLRPELKGPVRPVSKDSSQRRKAIRASIVHHFDKLSEIYEVKGITDKDEEPEDYDPYDELIKPEKPTPSLEREKGTVVSQLSNQDLKLQNKGDGENESGEGSDSDSPSNPSEVSDFVDIVAEDLKYLELDITGYDPGESFGHMLEMVKNLKSAIQTFSTEFKGIKDAMPEKMTSQKLDETFRIQHFANAKEVEEILNPTDVGSKLEDAQAQALAMLNSYDFKIKRIIMESKVRNKNKQKVKRTPARWEVRRARKQQYNERDLWLDKGDDEVGKLKAMRPEAKKDGQALFEILGKQQDYMAKLKTEQMMLQTKVTNHQEGLELMEKKKLERRPSSVHPAEIAKEIRAMLKDFGVELGEFGGVESMRQSKFDSNGLQEEVRCKDCYDTGRNALGRICHCPVGEVVAASEREGLEEATAEQPEDQETMQMRMEVERLRQEKSGLRNAMGARNSRKSSQDMRKSSQKDMRNSSNKAVGNQNSTLSRISQKDTVQSARKGSAENGLVIPNTPRQASKQGSMVINIRSGQSADQLLQGAKRLEKELERIQQSIQASMGEQTEFSAFTTQVDAFREAERGAKIRATDAKNCPTNAQQEKAKHKKEWAQTSNKLEKALEMKAPDSLKEGSQMLKNVQAQRMKAEKALSKLQVQLATAAVPSEDSSVQTKVKDPGTQTASNLGTSRTRKSTRKATLPPQSATAASPRVHSSDEDPNAQAVSNHGTPLPRKSARKATLPPPSAAAGNSKVHSSDEEWGKSELSQEGPRAPTTASQENVASPSAASTQLHDKPHEAIITAPAQSNAPSAFAAPKLLKSPEVVKGHSPPNSIAGAAASVTPSENTQGASSSAMRTTNPAASPAEDTAGSMDMAQDTDEAWRPANSSRADAADVTDEEWRPAKHKGENAADVTDEEWRPAKHMGEHEQRDVVESTDGGWRESIRRSVAASTSVNRVQSEEPVASQEIDAPKRRSSSEPPQKPTASDIVAKSNVEKGIISEQIKDIDRLIAHLKRDGTIDMEKFEQLTSLDEELRRLSVTRSSTEQSTHALIENLEEELDGQKKKMKQLQNQINKRKDRWNNFKRAGTMDGMRKRSTIQGGQLNRQASAQNISVEAGGEESMDLAHKHQKPKNPVRSSTFSGAFNMESVDSAHQESADRNGRLGNAVKHGQPTTGMFSRTRGEIVDSAHHEGFDRDQKPRHGHMNKWGGESTDSAHQDGAERNQKPRHGQLKSNMLAGAAGGESTDFVHQERVDRYQKPRHVQQNSMLGAAGGESTESAHQEGIDRNQKSKNLAGVSAMLLGSLSDPKLKAPAYLASISSKKLASSQQETISSDPKLSTPRDRPKVSPMRMGSFHPEKASSDPKLQTQADPAGISLGAFQQAANSSDSKSSNQAKLEKAVRRSNLLNQLNKFIQTSPLDDKASHEELAVDETTHTAAHGASDAGIKEGDRRFKKAVRASGLIKKLGAPADGNLAGDALLRGNAIDTVTLASVRKSLARKTTFRQLVDDADDTCADDERPNDDEANVDKPGDAKPPDPETDQLASKSARNRAKIVQAVHMASLARTISTNSNATEEGATQPASLLIVNNTLAASRQPSKTEGNTFTASRPPSKRPTVRRGTVFMGNRQSSEGLPPALLVLPNAAPT